MEPLAPAASPTGEQDSSPSVAGARPRRGAGRWIKLAVGLFISAVCMYFILRGIEFAALRDAFAIFRWPYLMLGMLSLTLGYGIRILRWWVMLAAGGAHVRPLACAAPFLGSIALNNVLPFRFGDIVRALVFPAAIGVSRSVATVSLGLERIVDLLTLLLCLGLALFLIEFASVPEWLRQSAAVSGIGAAGLLASMILFNRSLSRLLARTLAHPDMAQRHNLARVLGLGLELLQGLGAMVRPVHLTGVFGLSFLAWLGEAGLYWSVLAGFDLPAGLDSGLMVMALATLSTLVPSSPGYIGPFHLASFTAISLLGGGAALATSYALIAHLGLWLPTTLAGGIAIVMNQHLFATSLPWRGKP